MSVQLENLVLMPEMEARRALAGRRITFRVLAPVGAYAGLGTLRVLRASAVSEPQAATGDVELVCGYEAYDRLERQFDSSR